MKIVFFGTPTFSVPFLQALIDDPSIEVVAIVTQPDKPRGRGHDLSPSPVKILAQDHVIPVLQPASLKKDQGIKHSLEQLNADSFVVVAYGKIIPENILSVPPLGCINVHPSLLPRHRGPSPMQWAIASGDDQTGISIMLLDEGMDTGPILASETITLDDNDTYITLEKKVHMRGPQLLCNALKAFHNGTIKPIPQDDERATMTRLLSREDGHINWCDSMEVIERKSRAYDPWPGVFSNWERKAGVCLRLKLSNLEPVDFKADVPPGTVVTKGGELFVDCKDGTLKIGSIQAEGKQRMNAHAFIQGHPDIRGAHLS